MNAHSVVVYNVLDLHVSSIIDADSRSSPLYFVQADSNHSGRIYAYAASRLASVRLPINCESTIADRCGGGGMYATKHWQTGT